MSCRRSLRSLGIPTLVSALTLAAGCAGDSARDEALDGLERATQASELETEMAALVTETPDKLAADEGSTLAAESTEIGDRADEQISKAEGDADFDQEIVAGLNETKAASQVLAAAGEAPATVSSARGEAVRRLKAGNQKLGSAAVLIGEDLADANGALSDADAETLDVTLTDIDESGQAVAEAEASVGCTQTFAGSPPDVPPATIELPEGIACSEAQDVLASYDTAEKSGSGLFAEVGGWLCGKNVSNGGPLSDADGVACERMDGVRFFTLPG